MSIRLAGINDVYLIFFVFWLLIQIGIDNICDFIIFDAVVKGIKVVHVQSQYIKQADEHENYNRNDDTMWL